MESLKADWVKVEKERKCSMCDKLSNEFILMRDYAIGNFEYYACSEKCAIIKLTLSNPTLEMLYNGEWVNPYEQKVPI